MVNNHRESKRLRQLFTDAHSPWPGLESGDMADTPMANVALFPSAVLAPTLFFWMMVRLPRVVDVVGERIRRRRVQPTGLPIEQLAAALRPGDKPLHQWA